MRGSAPPCGLAVLIAWEARRPPVGPRRYFGLGTVDPGADRSTDGRDVRRVVLDEQLAALIVRAAAVSAAVFL
jgi:hypothetical protein